MQQDKSSCYISNVYATNIAQGATRSDAQPPPRRADEARIDDIHLDHIGDADAFSAKGGEAVF